MLDNFLAWQAHNDVPLFMGDVGEVWCLFSLECTRAYVPFLVGYAKLNR
jgi:hypothetical protein